MLIQISAPHFTAGLITIWGQVTEAPPIVHYMRGWSIRRVVHYCLEKKWEYALLSDGRGEHDEE